MIHWTWILVAFLVGVLIMAIFTTRRIQGLILWNRHFRDQRDEALKELKNVRELINDSEPM